VGLEARVDAVLGRVLATVVRDDCAEVAGAELAPNRVGSHTLILPPLKIAATHCCQGIDRELRLISGD
jgi:hypothetical protein